MCDPFGWHEIDEPTLHDIRKKLANFESMTMNEIFVIAKDRNHAVSIDKLCGPAQQRLKDLKLDDIEQLYSLRLSGAERVWSIRELNALILLWWDPNHQVCPSLPK